MFPLDTFRCGHIGRGATSAKNDARETGTFFTTAGGSFFRLFLLFAMVR
jgi:hypothetical protein